HTRWPRDWSSDVCSSDLAASRHPHRTRSRVGSPNSGRYEGCSTPPTTLKLSALGGGGNRTPVPRSRFGSISGRIRRFDLRGAAQIGRASCRERVDTWVVE